MGNRVLIVDDDLKLQKLLKEYLGGNGFSVGTLPDGSRILETIRVEAPDIVILDIMLPGKDGLEVLKDIRRDHALPVIMLTAKGEDTERIVGLELGADDYLPKPFNPRELLARMKAILRRAASPGREKSAAGALTIEAGGLTLNKARQTVSTGEAELELSSTEYRILEVLMKHPNTVLSRDRLMTLAQGRDFMAFDRSIDMHISKLRAKLEPAPRSPLPAAHKNRLGKRLYVCRPLMRPGKLYIKILLSFLAVLFTTLLVVFALFTIQPEKFFSTRLEEYAKTRALKIQAVLEAKMRAAPDADWSRNEPLQTFISDLGEMSGARVWLAKQDGAVLLKSFPGEIPELKVRPKNQGAVTYAPIFLHRQRDLRFYVAIPLAFPAGDAGHLHVLFDRPEGPLHPRRGFAFGLLIIGLMAALLIIPVSRIITNRLEQLRQSAQTLAEGNLAHRAAVRGRDEIGELARAFNRMADKLETMIISGKELTANISHELRTPLTRIRIAEEMLREASGTGAPHQERHLDAIREDIEELDRLIGRILELSKMELQDAPLTFTAFDPAELLQTLLQRFQSVSAPKGLRITTDWSGPSTFSGDKEALTTAFLNILDNAVKFTPEKGRITLRLRPAADTLEIDLTNTFEKLTDEELTKIFDPFHRTRKSPASGSGLGLAIAKKIIEKHGGRIEASNVEEGLEIRIFLPKKHPPD